MELKPKLKAIDARERAESREWTAPTHNDVYENEPTQELSEETQEYVAQQIEESHDAAEIKSKEKGFNSSCWKIH